MRPAVATPTKKKNKPSVVHSRLRTRPPNPTDAEVESFYCPGCSQFCSLQFLSPPLLTHSLSHSLSPLIACASLLLPPSLSLSLSLSETLQVAALCQCELPFQQQTSHPSLLAFAVEFLQLLCIKSFLSSHSLRFSFTLLHHHHHLFHSDVEEVTSVERRGGKYKRLQAQSQSAGDITALQSTARGGKQRTESESLQRVPWWPPDSSFIETEQWAWRLWDWGSHIQRSGQSMFSPDRYSQRWGANYFTAVVSAFLMSAKQNELIPWHACWLIFKQLTPVQGITNKRAEIRQTTLCEGIVDPLHCLNTLKSKCGWGKV